MRVIISPTPEILNDRKEARYYVRVEDGSRNRVFPVSVFIIKNHKLIEHVGWAPLEAKIVKLSYDFFDDFLLNYAVSTGDVQKVLEETTSTEKAFEDVLKDFSRHIYDFQVKEIYRLDFDGVNIYLIKTRRMKSTSFRERCMKLEELEKETHHDFFDDKDIPALHIISKYGEYKVPFDTARDEKDEPLNKFVLINEEEAKQVVEEALGRNTNWYEYPPVNTKRCLEDLPPSPPDLDYRVLYLSQRFIDLIYNNGKK